MGRQQFWKVNTMKISRIIGREIYNCLGWPTVECEIFLENGESVKASVPSGTSIGGYEALEIHDGGLRLQGRGVTKAIENIEKYLAPWFIGKEPHAIEMDLKIIELDGSQDKSRLGSNATLALSMALYRAHALIEGLELFELIAYATGSDTVSLPFPMLNIINGGMHANNALQIQEFMIVPVGATNFRTSFENAVIVYHELESILQKEGISTATGYEGGFCNGFENDTQALDMLIRAIESAEQKYKATCVIALDVAASELYNPNTKLYAWNKEQLTSSEMLTMYKDLLKKYPIYSLEDPFSQYDTQGWKDLTRELKSTVQIAGDDIFATQLYHIAQGVDQELATACVIKPNQVGTITESLQAIKLAKTLGLQTIASHRSGDTSDAFIADLALGASTGQIKCGAPRHSERLEKYNRLLSLEDDLTLRLLDA